jgi:hypothetical protein
MHHESYSCIEISGVDTDLTVKWEVQEVDDDYDIGDTHVWRTTVEYRILTVESSDEIYDFDYPPETPFEVSVAEAYQHNRFEP